MTCGCSSSVSYGAAQLSSANPSSWGSRGSGSSCLETGGLLDMGSGSGIPLSPAMGVKATLEKKDGTRAAPQDEAKPKMLTGTGGFCGGKMLSGGGQIRGDKLSALPTASSCNNAILWFSHRCDSP